MLAYRNVDSGTPFDVNATSTSSPKLYANCPAITTVSDNSLIITAGFLDDDVPLKVMLVLQLDILLISCLPTRRVQLL